MIVYKLLHRLSSEILPIAFWVLLLFGFDKPYIALITLICAVVHELGHYAAILLLKFDTGTPIGHFSGFRIRGKSIISYGKSILVFLGGPIANLIFAGLFLIPALFGGYAFMLFIINIGTAISNLLPIKGYDGYNVLLSLIKKRGFLYGEVWLRRVSFFLCTVFCFLSLYMMYYRDGGYWVFGIFIAMIISEMAESLDRPVYTNKREKQRF